MIAFDSLTVKFISLQIELSGKDMDGPLYLVSTLVFVRMNVACEPTTLQWCEKCLQLSANWSGIYLELVLVISCEHERRKREVISGGVFST